MRVKYVSEILIHCVLRC